MEIEPTIEPKENKMSFTFLILAIAAIILFLILIIFVNPACGNEIKLESGVNFIIKANQSHVGVLNVQHNILRLNDTNIMEMFEQQIAPDMNLSLRNLLEVRVVGEKVEIIDSNHSIEIKTNEKLCLDKWR